MIHLKFIDWIFFYAINTRYMNHMLRTNDIGVLEEEKKPANQVCIDIYFHIFLYYKWELYVRPYIVNCTLKDTVNFIDLVNN